MASHLRRMPSEALAKEGKPVSMGFRLSAEVPFCFKTARLANLWLAVYRALPSALLNAVGRGRIGKLV